MTKEKSYPTKKHIISDISFPETTSVNAYILKNTALGHTHDHCLPTVDGFACKLLACSPGKYMLTIDISRIYKIFRSCLLDWLLLGTHWRAVPFFDVYAGRAATSRR